LVEFSLLDDLIYWMKFIKNNLFKFLNEFVLMDEIKNWMKRFDWIKLKLKLDEVQQ